MLNCPEIGLRGGVLIAVAVMKPVVLKSRKMLATKSVGPVLETFWNHKFE